MDNLNQIYTCKISTELFLKDSRPNMHIFSELLHCVLVSKKGELECVGAWEDRADPALGIRFGVNNNHIRILQNKCFP